MHKKIIFFEKLNYINFLISLFYLAKYRNIYYRYSNIKFIENTFFQKYFICIGLHQKDGSYANQSFYLKKYLVRKFVQNNINDSFLLSFCSLINLKDNKIKKLKFTLENYFYDNKILVIDASSYVLTKKIFDKKQIIYFVDSIKSYLILREIDSKYFKLSKLILINIFFNNLFFFSKRVFKKLKLFSIKFFHKNGYKNKEMKGEEIYNTDNQIAYFPHSNLSFGKFFSKTFLFDKDKTSPLHKSKVDVIFFNETDNVSNRFLKINKINKIIISSKSNLFFKDLRKFYNFYTSNVKYLKNHKISIFFIFLNFFYEVKKFNSFFENTKYKYLFFYNDYLLPNSLLLSADIKNIKTISFQDRLTSYLYFNRVFFDYYFTSGQVFLNKFKFIYFINKIENIGLLRSNLINIHPLKHQSFKNKLISMRLKKFRIASVIFSTERSKNVSNLYGEDGTSLESNLNFLSDIIKLSEKFPNIFFLIKFKDEKYKTFKSFEKLEFIIKNRPNLKIISDDRISSANIISESEIVIGKQSTIIEESLIKNKFAFIYDTENFVSSFGFYRKKENSFYIKKNYLELEKSLNLLISGDKEFIDRYKNFRKNFFENYLSDNGQINDFSILKKRVKKLIELKNDQN